MYFTVIIAAYKQLENIKRAIDSVYAQEYPFMEILICSDGDDENVKKLVEEYGDPRLKYHFVEFQGQWGYRSRNEMVKIAKGDVILHLDQDNTFYKNCFLRINEEWDDKTGLLIFRINHQIGVIPKDEKIEHKNIDTMNGAIKKEIAQRCTFELKAPSADSLYYKQVEQICKDEDYKIKFIKDILGIHNEHI